MFRIFKPDCSYSLEGGRTRNIGQIKVVFQNVSGRICSDGWDDNDARVLCRQLGFEFGTASEHANRLHSPFLVTDVNCQGTETALSDCQLTLGAVTACRSGNTSGVLCTSRDGQYEMERDEGEGRLGGGGGRWTGGRTNRGEREMDRRTDGRTNRQR